MLYSSALGNPQFHPSIVRYHSDNQYSMYIGWFHHYIPKVFGLLAILVNPIFIYLIFSEKASNWGNYRYLLLYFAVFNVVYSITDILVPIGIHGYRYCFFLFLSDGLFFEQSNWNLYILSVRCSLISCSYAILISHFGYRYLVLLKSAFTQDFFPVYLIASFILCLLFFTFWNMVCHVFESTNPEVRRYIRDDFREVYGVDSLDMNMFSTLYGEGSRDTVLKSWAGTGLLTLISTISIFVFFLFGYLIMRELSSVSFQMSRKTANLQKSLLKALTVQTVIPICVSFAPCLLSWYAPAFNIDLGRGVNYTGVIALAAFPFFDPVAIVMCLPALRKRILGKKKKTSSNANSAPTRRQ